MQRSAPGGACSRCLRRVLSAAVVTAALGANGLAAGSSTADELPASPELSDYLALAEARHPGLTARDHEWRAGLAEADRAGSFPDPTLTYAWFGEEVETRVGPQKQRVSLRQRLPWFGTLAGARDVARFGADAAKARRDETRLVVHHDVIVVWADLVFQERSVAIAAENVEILRDLEAVVEERYRTSSARVADVVRVQVELGRMGERLAAITDSRRPAGARMNALLDRAAHSPLPASTRSREFPRAPSVERVAELLVTHAPALDERNADVAAAAAGERLAGRRRWPDWTVGLEWIRTDDALDPTLPGSGKDPWIASVGVDLPLFRGKYEGAVRASRERRAAAESRRRRETLNLQALAVATLQNWRNADRRLDLYGEQLVPKGRELLDTTLIAYTTGGGSVDDLVEAQRTLLDLRLDEAKAWRDRARAAAALHLVTGVDWTREESR